MWVSLKNKKFYYIQLSLEEVCHSSNTQVSLLPSKVKVFNAKVIMSTSKVSNCPLISSTVSEDFCSDLDSSGNYESLETKKSRKRVYNRTEVASNLVINESLSAKN